MAKKAKVLAIDPGTKNIGIAISDPDLVMAFARPQVTNTPQGLEQLIQLCQKEQVTTIVVGQPMIQGQHAINNNLKTELQTKLPEVEFIDFNEDFSTQDAIAELKASGASPEEITEMKDSYAARKILENYLANLT
jgi:RNase H-fold protein (predicted Holliday junction resolvase)